MPGWPPQPTSRKSSRCVFPKPHRPCQTGPVWYSPRRQHARPVCRPCARPWRHDRNPKSRTACAGSGGYLPTADCAVCRSRVAEFLVLRDSPDRRNVHFVRRYKRRDPCHVGLRLVAHWRLSATWYCCFTYHGPLLVGTSVWYRRPQLLGDAVRSLFTGTAAMCIEHLRLWASLHRAVGTSVMGALGTCIALTITSTGLPRSRASCFAPGFGLRRPVGSNIRLQAGSTTESANREHFLQPMDH